VKSVFQTVPVEAVDREAKASPFAGRVISGSVHWQRCRQEQSV